MSHEERAWSRALMASAGVALDHEERSIGPDHEWLEAGAANLDRARLAEFASHEDARIRETIALRPDCPMGLLATLAFDDSRVVRRAVASSPRLAPAIAAELTRDKDREVLRSLVRNPRTDETALRLLSSHRRAEVRDLARSALQMRGTVGAGMHLPGGDLDSMVPLELRDRWRPPQPTSSPLRPSGPARALAPRPSVGRGTMPGAADRTVAPQT